MEGGVSPVEVDSTRTSADDFAMLLLTIARIVTVFILLGMLIYGCYYAIQVFLRVGELIADTSTGKQSVESISDMIGAEQISIPIGKEEKLPLGRLVALTTLVFGYLVWSWIPLKIVGIVGGVLLRQEPLRSRPLKRPHR